MRSAHSRLLRRALCPIRRNMAVWNDSKTVPPPSKEMHSGLKLASATLIFERHYTPKELATLWALDETTIRRLFYDEPGVLKIGKTNRRDGKHDYVSLRIPESVALRVHRQRSE
jgi:hypothetical protein